jgi:hypothetical protein
MDLLFTPVIRYLLINGLCTIKVVVPIVYKIFVSRMKISATRDIKEPPGQSLFGGRIERLEDTRRYGLQTVEV